MVLLDRQVVNHSRFGGPFDRFNHRAFADGTEQRVTSFNLLRRDPAPPNDPEWMLWCRADDAPADMNPSGVSSGLPAAKHAVFNIVLALPASPSRPPPTWSALPTVNPFSRMSERPCPTSTALLAASRPARTFPVADAARTPPKPRATFVTAPSSESPVPLQ
jgi:hypothetical protein